MTPHPLDQHPYNQGPKASAGTHDAGAVDFTPTDEVDWPKLRRALRRLAATLSDNRPKTRPTVDEGAVDALDALAGRGTTPAARAYTNDRRAGRTHPDHVEMIEDGDLRFVGRGRARAGRPLSGRALRRAHGQRGSAGYRREA